MVRILRFFPFLMWAIIVGCSGAQTNRSNQSVSVVESGIASFNIDHHVEVPFMPAEITFAGERVPIENHDVRESLQRELLIITYQHGTTAYIMQLSGRYKPVVDTILKEEGLHSDFFYMCVTESMLQPLVSPANAQGYWQFLKETAREFDLEVSSQVDERYNWEKSTRAAARYFKKAYDKFGTWSLAAASYNIGMKNIADRIGYQSLTNYYDMQLPAETARYLYRAIAYKIILNNPEIYGFYIAENQKYKPLKYRVVEVNESIKNWSDFAAEHNTNFKMLKLYNEWIRSNSLKNRKKKKYQVWVPVEGSRTEL